ncbi:hypothetical protein ACEWZF_004474 [Escherichia coli]
MTESAEKNFPAYSHLPEKTVVFALIQTEEALNRRQINQALLSTGDLAHDEF